MFADPVKNLRSFSLRQDSIVADLGAGTGYYAIAAGAMVPFGKVYAVEVVKDFLTTIRNKAADAGLTNVECLWGDIEQKGGTKIGDAILDVAIASNVLFQLEDKMGFIEEIKRILKPHGRLLFVDWSADGPMKLPFATLRGSIAAHAARDMFEKKGFVLERHIDAGSHHYGMILIKS